MASLICVPMMLIPKPLILGIQMSLHKKSTTVHEPKRNSNLSEEDLGKKLN